MALGSALVLISVTGLALAIVFGWTSLARPWGFLLGFGTGICAGLGSTLVISGLLKHRKSGQ
jgi:hypothetical protein